MVGTTLPTAGGRRVFAEVAAEASQPGGNLPGSRIPCPSQSSGLPSGGLMIRPRNLAILAGAAAAAVAVLRHGRRATRGHQVPGGILIGHAGVYDTLSRRLLGPL